MDVYLSGSISGGRTQEHAYVEISDHLQARGHKVLSFHVARLDLAPELTAAPPEVFYATDVQWIEAYDLVVAEISTPSPGVGYEICYGLHAGKPALCLYDERVTVSKMITGITHPDFQVFGYSSVADMKAILDEFLAKLSSQDGPGPHDSEGV
jgi:nucleoside 2-deoxyribosyltransferase